jgi:hypothetical protein
LVGRFGSLQHSHHDQALVEMTKRSIHETSKVERRPMDAWIANAA